MNEVKIVERKREAHVSEEKKEEVKKIKELFAKYNTIALINLQELPSSQLQIMRKKLGEDTLIRVTKKRLIKKALEDFKEKKGIQDLGKEMEKVTPALLCSEKNAFKLSSFLKKNKSKVVAKPGQIAPKDIVVNAGPTPFTPGPIIGELGSMGIKATVEQGKIVVKEDAIVVKEGEEIKANVADLLAKLDIKPMELGLSLVAVYEDGLVLGSKDLDFDEEEYVEGIKEAAVEAFKLTIGIGYVTPENVQILIKKAENEAKALVKASGMITAENVGDALSKAEGEAKNVKGLVKDLPPEKEKKEEKPTEEKKEEIKTEEKSKEEVKKEEEVPSVHDLAEEKKLLEKASAKEDVPKIQDLAEKKEDKEEK